MSVLRLRTDGVGYSLDGESVDGFPDNHELTERQRVRIALWAQRFTPEDLNDIQGQLLRTRERPRASSRQKELAANRDDINELAASGLWSALEEDERRWVARPGAHPDLDDDVGYPLTTGDLETLTGATGRQLRHWIDQGLVPAVRSSRQRRIYSAGVAHALLLARLQQSEKAVLGAVVEGRAATFLRLLEAQSASRSHGPRVT